MLLLIASFFEKLIMVFWHSSVVGRILVHKVVCFERVTFHLWVLRLLWHFSVQINIWLTPNIFLSFVWLWIFYEIESCIQLFSLLCESNMLHQIHYLSVFTYFMVENRRININSVSFFLQRCVVRLHLVWFNLFILGFNCILNLFFQLCILLFYHFGLLFFKSVLSVILTLNIRENTSCWFWNFFIFDISPMLLMIPLKSTFYVDLSRILWLGTEWWIWKFNFFFEVILLVLFKFDEAFKSCLQLINVNVSIFALVSISLLYLLESFFAKSQVLL